MEGSKEAANSQRVGFIILYYSLISSTMLVINKVAVHLIPAPTFILLCQLLFSAGFAWGGGKAGWFITDALEYEKVRKFFWVVFGFGLTIYANIKVLQNSNVETFITFRSSTPLVLSICDYLFLGRQLPGLRSWGCLLVLVLGALGYVVVDSSFKLAAYAWLMVWFFFFTFDTVYVKYMCESVHMTNMGRVFYTNIIAIPFLLVAFPFTSEYQHLMSMPWSYSGISLLLISCIAGIWMSHASYMLRDAVSATSFTIVGIVCKLLTVVINCLIWDKHASMMGIGCLLVCVLAGSLYQQAPKREPSNSEYQPVSGHKPGDSATQPIKV